MGLTRSVFNGTKLLMLLFAIAGILNCGRAETKFGKPVAWSSAVPLAELLSDPGSRIDQDVVVEARIGEVCRTSGCWCLLEDGKEQLYVSMTTFSLPSQASGEWCRAEGRLTLRSDRLTLVASGIELVSD